MGKQMVLFPDDGGPRFEVKAHPHVELREGRAYIEGSRVPVSRVWSWHRRGTPIATLFARYPMLGHARVLSALAFAYDNESFIERDLQLQQEGAGR